MIRNINHDLITTFDLPQPEEIFFSACARCATDLLFPSKEAVMEYLFGQKHLQVAVDFPAHIQAFVGALPPGHILTVDRLIDQHSALPFYAPFLPATRVAQVREGMTVGLGRGLQARTGVVASPIPLPARLRYCPLCVADDRHTVGFGYWRRVHQLPGVHVCPDHAVWLNMSSACAWGRSFKDSLTPAEGVVQEGPAVTLDLTNFEHQVQLDIARGARFLLTHNLASQPEDIRRRYQLLLAERGLATYRGTVKMQVFLRTFQNRYASKLLEIWGLAFDSANTKGWLARLVRADDHYQHPICHLLLMHFLDQTPASFFALTAERKPFGDGPWPCLNPACQHYRQLHIQACQIDYRLDMDGRPKGIFTCSCGFVYSRAGPDTTENDRWYKTRIEAYGPVWEAALQTGWVDADKSLKDIAGELSTDTATIKRNAARLGLSFARAAGMVTLLSGPPPIGPTSGTRPDMERLEQHKRDWLAAVEHHRDIGVKALADMLPAAYRALSRNAADWLKDHTPHKQANLVGIKTGKTPIDWEERDQRLSEAVLQSAARLRSQPGRPVWITRHCIARDINKRGLLANQLHRLPGTAAVLASVVETPQAFTVRRMWYVTEQARDAGYTLTQAELFDQANAWPYRDDSMVQRSAEVMLASIDSSIAARCGIAPKLL